MFKPRQCIVCGRDYIPTNGRQKICKSVDCQRELWRWKHRRQKYGHKQPGKPLVKPNTLVSDAMDAKEAGMSYGQYMASKLH